jgi:hypothetical protein
MMTGDFPKVWLCSQCSRGVNGFTGRFIGHGGSLQNGVIDAVDPKWAHMTLKALNSEGMSAERWNSFRSQQNKFLNPQRGTQVANIGSCHRPNPNMFHSG